MPETKTGWTDKLPESQGWYWVRSGSLGLPVAVEFFPALMDRRQPMVRYPGKNGFMVAVAEDAKPEWLGPISPSDFDQLTRLREALQEIADRDTLCNCEHDTEFCCAKVGHYCAFCIAATALNPELAQRKGEKS